MTVFRNTILKRTNQTSKMLQSEPLICAPQCGLLSLHQFLAEQRSQERLAHLYARRQILRGSTRFSEKRLKNQI